MLAGIKQKITDHANPAYQFRVEIISLPGFSLQYFPVVYAKFILSLNF